MFSNIRPRLAEVPSNAIILYVMGGKFFYPKEPERLFKIGIADSPATLLNCINRNSAQNPTGKRQEIKLLAALYAQRSDEQFIHKNAFSNYSLGTTHNGVHTEWYPQNDGITQWVEFLMAQPYVARNIEQLNPDLKIVTNSDSWLPKNRKLKKTMGLFTTRIKDTEWSDFDKNHIMQGSYYTEPDYTRIAREELWFDTGIVLDPTSCHPANYDKHCGVQALNIFTMDDRAERQEWKALTVWFNPPWGQWGVWIPKMLNELECGNVKELCLICPCTSTSTQYLTQAFSKAAAILLPSKRIKYWGPKAGGANTDSFLVYFGNRKDAFRSAYGLKGPIFFSSNT